MKTKQNKNNKGKVLVEPKERNVLGMINCLDVVANGKQKELPRGTPQVKFSDVNYAVAATSVGAVLAGICSIPQGITVNQRTGDTAFWKELSINYQLDTQNADIFTTTRVIVFQWHPNSLLIGPVVTDILQTANVRSMYDWQYSNQYRILYDKVHFQSGIAAAPDSSGNQGYFGPINIKSATKRAQFATASVAGSEQFYILLISDSLIAPFPNFTATTRITYSEE